MKSIERRFRKIENENPYWSSYICFARSISGQNFSEDRLRRMFNKLVDKNEYAQDEKKEIIKYLLTLNIPLNRTENEEKTAREKEKINISSQTSL